MSLWKSHALEENSDVLLNKVVLKYVLGAG